MRRYYPKYLDKEVYKRVLSVARSYYQDLNKIKQIENDYIFMSSQSNGAGSNNITDTTFNKVYQIEKHTKLLRQRTKAVEKSMSKFTDEEQNIIRQNIMQEVPMIYCDTSKSERSIKTIRHGFLMLLANELGEVV